VAGGALLAVLALGCASGPPGDPWQAWNKPVFRFNDTADRYVLRPVARGWTFVTFEAMRESIDRFFFNLAFPSRFVSSAGQAEPEEALNELGRFLVNSTVGIGGLFDPASHFGFARHEEDIGQMFGVWGIPTGPYLVLPLLGPSNPRDAVGFVGDTLLSPLLWIPVPVYGTGLLNIVNRRALADEQIENARRTALDYYVFVRDAFMQNRQAAVEDRAEPSRTGLGGISDDLYDVPEEAAPDAPTP
jgi:phospholipid-binding lipoprotein MlaA